MEQGDDCAFKFWTTARVDCGWGEGFPDDRFADVGRNEQGNATAETVAFLEKLVKQDDNKTGKNQLHDEKEADSGTKVAGLTV